MKKSIFETDPSSTNKNAYLNWWFDHRMEPKEIQVAWDFLNLGKAYYGNALTSLGLLMDSKNACGIADKLIFPILFDFWHGTELLLKSGLYLIEQELKTNKQITKLSHKNLQLYYELKSKLRKIGFAGNEILSLEILLKDFEKQNASETFMRYTVDNKFNDQFYVEVTPDGENVCINLDEFITQFCNVIEELPVLIEFLGSPYFEDYFIPGQLNKENYNKYKKMRERIYEKFQERDMRDFTEKLDITNKLLNWVYMRLL